MINIKRHISTPYALTLLHLEYKQFSILVQLRVK